MSEICQNIRMKDIVISYTYIRNRSPFIVPEHPKSIYLLIRKIFRLLIEWTVLPEFGVQARKYFPHIINEINIIFLGIYIAFASFFLFFITIYVILNIVYFVTSLNALSDQINWYKFSIFSLSEEEWAPSKENNDTGMYWEG